MNAVAEVVEEFGGLDVAVANAGIAQKQFATVRGISGEEWERVFEVDMLGVWRTVRAALPQIVERKGQIVVVSSVYAFANGFGNSPYAVAKAGVESLGRALRVELKPHGASASVAYFGWVDTKLVQDAFAQESAGRVRRTEPEWLLKRITPRRGRRRPGARDRRTGPADLRPQVVALRLRPARHASTRCSTSGWRANRNTPSWSATSTPKASIAPRAQARVSRSSRISTDSYRSPVARPSRSRRCGCWRGGRRSGGRRALRPGGGWPTSVSSGWEMPRSPAKPQQVAEGAT